MLRVAVADDGVGGARAAADSGLAGLRDRLEALDATLVDRERAGPRHDRPRRDPMRVVIADDAPLIREGVARLLTGERRRGRGSGRRRRRAARERSRRCVRTSR